NNYGNTIVASGGLVGKAASIRGDIENYGMVEVYQQNAGVFGGNITGSGWLQKVGFGSLTLTGNNSYTGGTTVSYGTLIGDTDSLQGSITNDAMLVFDQAGNGTYGGIIGGTGTVTKQGSGTLIMNGSNTYTGDTMV